MHFQLQPLSMCLDLLTYSCTHQNLVKLRYGKLTLLFQLLLPVFLLGNLSYCLECLDQILFDLLHLILKGLHIGLVVLWQDFLGIFCREEHLIVGLISEARADKSDKTVPFDDHL